MLERILGKQPATCFELMSLAKRRIPNLLKTSASNANFFKDGMLDLLATGREMDAYHKAEQFYDEFLMQWRYRAVEKYCDFLLDRLPALENTRHCPEDCKEAVSSLMLAASGIPNFPELSRLRDIFQERYGNSVDMFANEQFAIRLSPKIITLESTARIMRRMASKSGIQWDDKSFVLTARKLFPTVQDQPNASGPVLHAKEKVFNQAERLKHVHPKLPNYDDFVAYLTALNWRNWDRMLDRVDSGEPYSFKCDVLMKLVKTRILILRRWRDANLTQLIEAVAELLAKGCDIDACDKALHNVFVCERLTDQVEGVIAEVDMLDCYDHVEKACDCLLENLSSMEKTRHCPEEYKEAVASLMLGGSQLSEIPELRRLRDIFQEKYGSMVDVDVFANELFARRLPPSPISLENKISFMRIIASGLDMKWDAESFVLRERMPSPTVQDEPNGRVSSNDAEYRVHEDIQEILTSDEPLSRRKPDVHSSASQYNIPSSPKGVQKQAHNSTFRYDNGVPPPGKDEKYEGNVKSPLTGSNGRPIPEPSSSRRRRYKSSSIHDESGLPKDEGNVRSPLTGSNGRPIPEPSSSRRRRYRSSSIHDESGLPRDASMSRTCSRSTSMRGRVEQEVDHPVERGQIPSIYPSRIGNRRQRFFAKVQRFFSSE